MDTRKRYEEASAACDVSAKDMADARGVFNRASEKYEARLHELRQIEIELADEILRTQGMRLVDFKLAGTTYWARVPLRFDVFVHAQLSMRTDKLELEFELGTIEVEDSDWEAAISLLIPELFEEIRRG